MILACIRVCFWRVKFISPSPPTPMNIAVWTLCPTLREVAKDSSVPPWDRNDLSPLQATDGSSVDLISSYMQTDTVLLNSPCQRHTSRQVCLQKWKMKKKEKAGQQKGNTFSSEAYCPRRNPSLWIHLKPAQARCVSFETPVELVSGILQVFLSSPGASFQEPSSSKTQRESWQRLSHRPSGIWLRLHKMLSPWGQQHSSGFWLPGWGM